MAVSIWPVFASTFEGVVGLCTQATIDCHCWEESLGMLCRSQCRAKDKLVTIPGCLTLTSFGSVVDDPLFARRLSDNTAWDQPEWLALNPGLKLWPCKWVCAKPFVCVKAWLSEEECIISAWVQWPEDIIVVSAPISHDFFKGNAVHLQLWKYPVARCKAHCRQAFDEAPGVSGIAPRGHGDQECDKLINPMSRWLVVAWILFDWNSRRWRVTPCHRRCSSLSTPTDLVRRDRSSPLCVPQT